MRDFERKTLRVNLSDGRVLDVPIKRMRERVGFAGPIPGSGGIWQVANNLMASERDLAEITEAVEQMNRAQQREAAQTNGF